MSRLTGDFRRLENCASLYGCAECVDLELYISPSRMLDLFHHQAFLDETRTIQW